MPTVYDISQPLRPSTAVWPGDQRFEHTWTMQRSAGDSVNLSRVQMSLHTGTHADAPLHVQDGGAVITDVPLSSYIGPAYVLDVQKRDPEAHAIAPHHMDVLPKDTTRVLFKTPYSNVSPNDWSSDWWPLKPDIVEVLRRRGIVLVGTDAPSVDPESSKTLDAHHALAKAGIVHLELLRLKAIREGAYELSALPLRIEGADAAPVRAILRDIPTGSLSHE